MSKIKSESKIVISLTSSAVELSIVEFAIPIRILFSKKEKLLIKNSISSQEFMKKSFSALSKILDEKSIDIKSLSKKIKTCEIIFHSPWFLPEIVNIKNKKEKVSLKKFFVENTKPPKQNDYKQIENKITNILLNGYHLTKLKDENSNDIEINIYRSYISKETADLLVENIQNKIPQINLFNFSSSIMQSYESIKNLFIDEDNLIFLNIGGEITEIGIIIDDVLVSALTIPSGSHSFVRKLDTFTSSTSNLGILKFLGDKNSDEKLNLNIDKKINTLINNWLNEILDTIKANYLEYPKKIFIISDSEYLDFFKTILDNNSSEFKFNFHTINKDLFENRVIFDKMNTQNTEFLLSAYYLSIKN